MQNTSDKKLRQEVLVKTRLLKYLSKIRLLGKTKLAKYAVQKFCVKDDAVQNVLVKFNFRFVA